jgi:hypothetical protein
VRLLAWAAKHQGYTFPQHVLECIGDYLQMAPLWDDWRAGRMDIDVFIHGPPIRLQGWTRCRELEPYDKGLYAVLPNVDRVEVWRKGTTLLNIIQVLVPVKTFLDSFDFDFCTVSVHDPRPVSFYGLGNVTKYQEILRYLRDRIDLWNECAYPPPGLSAADFAELARQVRATMVQRLTKYERRRFTITNRDEWLALAT